MAAAHFYEFIRTLDQVGHLSAAADSLFVATKRLLAGEQPPHHRVRRLSGLLIVQDGQATLPRANRRPSLAAINTPLFDARYQSGKYDIVAAMPVSTSIGSVLCGASYQARVKYDPGLRICANGVMCLLPEEASGPPPELSTAAAAVESLAAAMETMRCNQEVDGKPGIWAATW